MNTHSPAAADSGASATDVFRQSGRSSAGADIPLERVQALIGDAIKAMNDIAEKHSMTYEEFNILKGWLIQVGEDGEWPLWLDVFLEHTIEDIVTRDRKGSKGSIFGPYYVPGSPVVQSPATIPMRDDEKGTRLKFTGRIADVDGNALTDATIELWQADEEGYYSQFAPDIPEWNLRVTVPVDSEGNFEINTIQPAAYQIPTDGSTGKMIAAIDGHAWRPAHLHILVKAPGHQDLIQQLYFHGDEHNDDDVAQAVKPELMLDPQPDGEGGKTAVYNYQLDKA
ncbi:MAG: catechol 1,2-dioxygenase [Actinomycetales bacterium]|nr:catechol 1,2-dioxygenase [Actinomycetales bacterium]